MKRLARILPLLALAAAPARTAEPAKNGPVPEDSHVETATP